MAPTTFVPLGFPLYFHKTCTATNGSLNNLIQIVFQLVYLSNCLAAVCTTTPVPQPQDARAVRARDTVLITDSKRRRSLTQCRENTRYT